MSGTDETCACGRALHYSSPDIRAAVEQVIEVTGQRYMPVTTPDGTFLVDKHYIALHGLKGNEVAHLGFVREPDA